MASEQDKAMTNDDYMMCLRDNVLQVADALKPENIEECRYALQSIALGLIPESKLRELGAICCGSKERTTKLGEKERCGNCDHDSDLHNIHGCTVRIQLENHETMVDCPCAWTNLQASSLKGK